jgi:hypothetical protein
MGRSHSFDRSRSPINRPSRLYVSKHVKPAVQGEIDALFVGGMGEDRASGPMSLRDDHVASMDVVPVSTCSVPDFRPRHP